MPWHEDAFLLLPGDGCILVDAQFRVVHVDRFAHELVPQCPSPGDDLQQAWPAVADLITAHATAILATGPTDIDLEREGHPVLTRLFRTDDGWGIGTLAPDDNRVGSGPSFTLYDRVLRAVNETVMVTTAEPFDAPGPIIVYVNDAFLRDSGYARHEVLGRSPRLLQGPMTSDEAKAQFRGIFEKWGSGTVVVENLRRDGTPFWVRIDVAPVADATGWYTHWVSVQRDVTDLKAEEAEREARRLMVQALLDSLPSRSALLDRSGRIVATNAPWGEAWRANSVRPEPPWLGMDYLAICRAAGHSNLPGAADGAAVAAGIADVLSGVRESFGYDYMMSALDPPEWFHLEVRPLRGREGVIVTHVDVSQRRRAEEELDYQAEHDPLTGLTNRDALQQALDATLAEGPTRPFAFVLVDLDDFKTINDAYGHAHGDRILEEVATRLADAVGPDDLVARLGGDEFAIVLHDIATDWDPGTACAAVRACLYRPIDIDIASVRLSGSIGVVTVPPHRGDARAILRDADTAMYVSKGSGRDRWTLFREEHREVAQARAVSRERLESALADNEFELWFQPFVDMATGRTVASEALLRWRHPTEGVLAPAAFLGAFEAGPLIDDLGAWVLDAALATQSSWQRAAGADRHIVSVNLSPRQLGRGRLPDLVLRALDRHGVPAANLELEVLESDLISTDDKIESELRDLHDMGVRIAIDDFGTGYSALAYLQTFPVDAVKIDRTFVQRSDTPRGARLLRATAELSRAVGATAIAEGIETTAQLAAVQSAGIAWGQGYLLGRPAPAGSEPLRAAPQMFS